jgi:hypothetical protein
MIALAERVASEVRSGERQPRRYGDNASGLFVLAGDRHVHVAGGVNQHDAGEYVSVPVRPIALLNTTIVAPDDWSDDPENPVVIEAVRISQREAAAVVRAHGFVSHIGHDSTAAIASTILRAQVPMDRTPFAMQIGDRAICIKLRGRAPEGTVLTADEVEAIGYDLIQMERKS